MSRKAVEEADRLRKKANEIFRGDPRTALRYAEEANVKNHTADGDRLITIIKIHMAAAVRVPSSPDGRDWYGILQVTPSDNYETIRANYKRLCLHTHPDKAKKFDGCDDAFRLLHHGWNVLGDAKKRKEYDDSLSQRRTSGAGRGPAGGPGGGGGGGGGVHYNYHSSPSAVPPARSGSGSGSTPSSSSSATVARPTIQDPYTVEVTCTYCRHSCRRKYSMMLGRMVLSNEMIACTRCQRNFYPPRG